VWRDRLAEFADCLHVGLLVAVAAVPVVTAGPAFGAGCAVVARWRTGESPPILATFRTEFVRQLRGGIVFTLGVIAAAVLVATDLALVRTEIPGTGFVRPALIVLSGFFALVVLRACSLVAEHDGQWLPALRSAVRVSRRVRSLLLLAAAAATAVVLVWTQPLLLFLVPGPLALAAVGTNP
jgi:uncharacterized membrane protein YesL